MFHPSSCYICQLPLFTFSLLFFPPLRPLNSHQVLGGLFSPLLRLSGLQHSNNISATLEADRQAGEAFLSGCVTPGSSRCIHTHIHTHMHNQCEKTRLGPRSERPLQNQLAFKLMKRVMKRVLSLLQTADRQAEGWLWFCIRKTHWKEHQRYSNGHFGPYFS